MPRTAGRLLAAALLLVLAQFAAAQVCRQELVGALQDRDLLRPATGVDAALLMRRAVELVEPALPALVSFREVGVPEDHPAYEDVGWVRARRLLPPTWGPGALDAEAWREMVSRFLGWYKLDGPLPDAPATVGDLVEDMSATLDRVGRAVRPAALLAWDPRDDDKLSFWAIIWNWTVYPRLLVFRPDPSVDLRGSPRDVLPHLSNCAVRVAAYITAPEDTAKSLFLAHNESRMFVVATQPEAQGWPLEVPQGAELDAFAFALPELSGARVYAAVFDGPEVGFGTILRLMTRVRTNLSPAGFLSHLQSP
jgi:hypothetical protein